MTRPNHIQIEFFKFEGKKEKRTCYKFLKQKI